MKLAIYQIDAFTDRLFRGNPAAVVPLEQWAPVELMQKIASENNLAETAFFVKDENQFLIRWFTPTVEVELCGHATLASAHVLYEHLGYAGQPLVFKTMKRGDLNISRSDLGIEMDFPLDSGGKVAITELKSLRSILGVKILDAIRGHDDILIVLEDEDLVRQMVPDFRGIQSLSARGIIITAKASDPFDFVSRCFFPRYGIDEDPVTGSAHTLLAPYWADKLGKNNLRALQASARSGIVHCKVQGDRVLLTGKAVTYLTGIINTANGLSS
ncbi:MAG: PhzF family phenazine biosynthesis protein [Saprospiraceae bacterium]|nr:PhzF family phenazine biosynthesis protein [Saprospiraceae bacterium]